MNELRLIPLSEVASYGVGETVPRTKGLVKAVFERKTGVHPQHGEWSFQNFILKDGQSEVVCKASGKDDISQLKGKEVWIVGFQSEKHGITGIKVDEYQGKKQLNITKTANIIVNDGTRLADKVDAPAPTYPARAEQTAPPKDKYIPMGQTVGMAVNNACAYLIHNGKALDPKEIARISSDILRVSRWLDEGNLTPKVDEEPKGEPDQIQCIKCLKMVDFVEDTGECVDCFVPF